MSSKEVVLIFWIQLSCFQTVVIVCLEKITRLWQKLKCTEAQSGNSSHIYFIFLSLAVMSEFKLFS